MVIQFQPITQAEAEIIAEWQYPGEYSFYDMKADQEDYEEFIDPDQRSKHTQSVWRHGELIGFFTSDPVDAQTINIGLGMHPDLTGKGEGQLFLQEGLQFIFENYAPSKVTLAVAVFNKRAIKVYERAGFVVVKTFQQPTNGGIYEFVKMENRDEGQVATFP
ncbi:GNAT family N-acetyltransferase [Halobacillus naozhouensis]|uniref:GNAT family protein n=1 Tax=Halobacillus naozhouensis TaxID=554880 RepID=A0ABY8IYZ8_9BACI|nr:GNAT family protein [Halobacillus naozhouensis]WFT74524.1 GNAT family protein [Halobacillus naozhouensis]